MKCTERFRSRGFTLVELLVVIGIITLLVGILLPAVSRAREHARQIECASNTRQIFLAIELYTNDNYGKLPLLISPGPSNQTPFEAIRMISTGWVDYDNGVLWPYVAPDILTRQRIFNCPSEPDPKVSDPPNLVAGAPTPPRNFSYDLTFELNKYSMGSSPLLYGSNARGLYGIYAMPFSMVLHPEHKFLVIEEYSPASISSVEDVCILGGNVGGSRSALGSRHFGKANIAFFDGHCEAIDRATFGGLDALSYPPAYSYWVNVLDGGGIGG